MSGTIVRAEREVQLAIDVVRRCAEPKADSTLADTERELWTALLVLGRALMSLFLARCAARPHPDTYELEGRRYVFDAKTRRKSEVGTRFGKVPFHRAVGRPIGGRRAVDLPIDRQLGLCSGFSLGTTTAVVHLCTLMAFETARRVFSGFHEWAPSSRAVLRMIDAVGSEARGFLDAHA